MKTSLALLILSAVALIVQEMSPRSAAKARMPDHSSAMVAEATQAKITRALSAGPPELVTIRQTTIAGDASGETHSAWTLEFVGTSGKTCILSWRVLRKWDGSRVVYEYHYDEQQSGGPLTLADFSFNPVTPAARPRRPS